MIRFYCNVTLLITLFFSASAAVADDSLVGFWQHSEQPSVIEIVFTGAEGVGLVRRNDVKPDAVGRTLIRNLVATGKNSFSGEIFAERLSQYKSADITLVSPQHMQITVKVGLMSKTIDWKRVTENDAK